MLGVCLGFLYFYREFVVGFGVDIIGVFMGLFEFEIFCVFVELDGEVCYGVVLGDWLFGLY